MVRDSHNGEPTGNNHHSLKRYTIANPYDLPSQKLFFFVCAYATCDVAYRYIALLHLLQIVYNVSVLRSKPTFIIIAACVRDYS